MMRVTFLTVMLLIAATSTAHAYLDPGTGSIILQALAAGAIAVGIFWRRVLDFVKKLFGGKAVDKNEDQPIE